MTLLVRLPAPRRAERLAGARAVIGDVAHHSDHLIRLASNGLVTHGETAVERKDARVLLVVAFLLAIGVVGGQIYQHLAWEVLGL